MQVLYVHLLLDASTSAEMSDIAAVTQSHVAASPLRGPTGQAAVMVRRLSALSQTAAVREETAAVLTELRNAGVQASHVATTVLEKGEPDSDVRWALLRRQPRSVWLRARTSNSASSSWRHKALSVILRRSVVLIIGVQAYITASDRHEAERQGRAIAREPVHGRVIEVPGGGGRSPAEQDRRFGYVVVVSGMLAGLILGFTSAEIPATAILIGGAIAVLAYASASRPPLGASRTDRIGATILATFLAVFLYFSISHFYNDASEAAAYLAAALGGLALSSGVLTEWRTRKLGQSLSWTLPIILSLLGPVPRIMCGARAPR